MPRHLPALATPRNYLALWPGTQHADPFPGMLAATETRCIMRPYLKVIALIVGLVGTYLALLPLVA
jgi:hypothetical protein